MRHGFTLIEVVVALIVLEVSVLGVLGSLVLAADIMRQAEGVERGVARAEGVLDSLGGGAVPGEGSRRFGGGRVDWVVGDDGAVMVTVVHERDGEIARLHSRVGLQ